MSETQPHLSQQLTLESHQVDIWQFGLRDYFDQRDVLLPCLSEPERKRLQCRNGLNLALSRCLLRHLLSRYIALAPAKIAFQYTAKGKPYLEHHNIEFNLSHSGDQMVCAVGRRSDEPAIPNFQRPLGVDIECGRSIKFLEDLAERCLTQQEQQTLKDLPDAAQAERFIHYWSCKEAYAKAVGEGLSIAFNSIQVELEPLPCFIRLPNDTPSHWQLYRWQTITGNTAALAYPGQPVNIVFRSLDLV